MIGPPSSPRRSFAHYNHEHRCSGIGYVAADVGLRQDGLV
jgi:hypothetical protein